MGLFPGSGRSPGGAHGNPLQYSCLENPLDRGAWRATAHGVAESQTWLKQPSMQQAVRLMFNIPHVQSYILFFPPNNIPKDGVRNNLHFFIQLYNAPLCVCTTVSLNRPKLMGIWVVFSLLLCQQITTYIGIFIVSCQCTFCIISWKLDC